MDAEEAHHFAMSCHKKGLVPKAKKPSDPTLHTKFCGLNFSHPIGLAAGFDKQTEAIQQTLDLGFAFTEVGGVVPLPQSGNPKPRLFRIPEAHAVINRFNFNSDGFDICLERVRKWHLKNKGRDIVGINIAKGDHYTDAAEAYILGLQTFAPHVSFVTVNVSCPNEPDARNLEGRDQLKDLLQRVQAAHNALQKKPLLFVKISPDQTPQQTSDIAEVALTSGIDAMIIGNTTSSRPTSIMSATVKEKGGLSGKPLFELSTKILADIYRLTKGEIPLIGCGGVFTGADAYAKIRAGASLIQIYTALVYEGPFVISRIANELSALLKRDGFKSINEAVGADFG